MPDETSKNGQTPEDIHPDWLNVVRAAQAACKDNKGYGVMTVIVAVVKNKPVLWEPKMRRKLHPSSMAKKEMSPETMGALMAFMEDHVDEPVIVPDKELT